MAITFLENFSDMPTDKALSAQSPVPFGSIVGGYTAFTTVTTTSGKTDGLFAEVANGKTWLTRFNTGVAYANLVMSNIRDQIPLSATGKFTIGFRMYAKTGYSAAWNVAACRMNASAQAPAVNFAAGATGGYVELLFDRTAGTVEVFLDGTSQAVTTIGSSSIAAIRAGTETIGLSVGGVPQVSISDVYITVDTGDASQNGRLGAIEINAIDLQVSGDTTGWDVTSLADVLARGDYETTDSGTRVTGTGADKVLKLVPKTGYSLPNKTAVLGMMAQVKNNYKPGAPANLQVSLSRGTNIATATPVSPSTLSAQPQTNLMWQALTTDEQAFSTVLTNLGLSLTVKAR